MKFILLKNVILWLLVKEAEKALSASIGRACRITQGKRKGKVEIEYYGVDDLNNLLEALEEMNQR